MHFSASAGKRRPVSWYFLILGVSVMFSLLLGACGSTGSTGGSNSQAGTPKVSIAPPNNLMNAGVLSVGSELTYPPKEFTDTATGKATGFDIELITEMAKRMGLQTNIVSTRFDTIIDDLNNKRFDVVISGMHITPQREQKADFVEYARSGESLLVAKGNPEQLSTYDQLCGKKVGVQGGSLQQDRLNEASKKCTQAGKQPIQLTVLASQAEVVGLLVNKRVDATLQVSAISSYYLKQNPGTLDVGKTVMNTSVEGIAIRKGDTAMKTAVQKAFDEVKADGTYKKLLDKWGLDDESL